MILEEMEQALRQRLEALLPAARAELLHVLRLPDLDGIERIGDFWGNRKTRSFAEGLIDCEGDHAPRAVLVGCLGGRSGGGRSAIRDFKRVPFTPTTGAVR